MARQRKPKPIDLRNTAWVSFRESLDAHEATFVCTRAGTEVIRLIVGPSEALQLRDACEALIRAVWGPQS